ncbi:MAG: DUF3375 domain-containing protein [Magnetococcales bacterium]|nr:DUF3375 domain-containing protein [Magnetococcales bacterium]
MTLDYTTLAALQTQHPAWKLLRAEHAPLVASFLHRVFVAPNVRVMAATDLEERLEDELYLLREQLGKGAFPLSALDYLNDWASHEKGWLRKFYRQGSDDPHFDLTPATEKAIAWLGTLTERSFVGTESRLLTVFELLRQMSEGSESDPEKRIAELEKRRTECENEIARIRAGNMLLLDETAIKDRFQQFVQLARELLTDFREVEHNFRQLDRRVRERIALWEEGKGALLEEIMGERDHIADTDQGRSFRAFWDFLMSTRRQEELSERLDRVLALPPVLALQPDARTRRIHYDWLEAGEHAQRTVAQLSQQLRHFLDDQAWLENRRIMDILHGVEAKALALRDHFGQLAADGTCMRIAESAADIELPMERPLYTPTLQPLLADVILAAGDADLDTAALYAQVVIDRLRLDRHIRQLLQNRLHVTLRELTAAQPLQQGLAELVAYLQLGSESFHMRVDENTQEVIIWKTVTTDGTPLERHVRLPQVIFAR